MGGGGGEPSDRASKVITYCGQGLDGQALIRKGYICGSILS